MQPLLLHPDSKVPIIKISTGIMRILYGNIETIHDTFRIVQATSKILLGIIFCIYRIFCKYRVIFCIGIIYQ